jgi:hypothetical protein
MQMSPSAERVSKLDPILSVRIICDPQLRLRVAKKDCERLVDVIATLRTDLEEIVGAARDDRPLVSDRPPTSIAAQVKVDETDDCDVWIRISLRSTKARGRKLQPFTSDLNAGAWLQGWADGETLTLAASEAALPLAVGLVRVFLSDSEI